jgi:hypothetical protein
MKDYTKQKTNKSPSEASQPLLTEAGLPLTVQQIVLRDLQENENIRWAQRPMKINDVFRENLNCYWIAVPLTIVTIIWLMSELHFRLPRLSHINDFKPIFTMLPMYIISGAFLYMPFAAARKAKHSYYVITDQNVMIISGVSMLTANIIPAKQITSIQKNINSNGSGNIEIGFQEILSNRNSPYISNSNLIHVKIVGLSDVYAAYSMLKELQEQQKLEKNTEYV